MTYRQLLFTLLRLDPDQLDFDVTVMVLNEEFYPVKLSINTCEDVLSEGHPYFIPKLNGG